MKIAFNPSTVEALTTPPNNKDITFDLRGQNIFARGVKFYGTDTNTWRDIKINNVSIGSHTLDLRNGSNTTLTNTNGVVTINSTWRPVVDNLTSDSTTSSLSAKQGKVLKALIDGKSNSDHNHDGRYLKLTGGTMASNALITFADSGSWDTSKKPQGARGGLYWTGQSDYAKLYAEETVVDNLDLVIQFGDDNSNGLSIRNKDNTQTSYISSSGVITTGTFKGNLDWSYITNKPASYTPSAHTHAWNSLTHSSTTENQAILTNGKANGWKLYTLNISRWDNAANNAHSHANKSVLDGITSALVNSWNTAYNFVSNITGTDTDKVINKWEEIVNFLAGITEDNKLNTLLNSKLSIQQLSAKDILTTKTNNALFWVDTKGNASTITTGPFTDHPYALLSVTNYNQNAENYKFFYRSRLAFSSAGDIKVASCHHEYEYQQDETWYNVLTSKNSGINGSTIKLNGTSITVYSSGTADGRYVRAFGTSNDNIDSDWGQSFKTFDPIPLGTPPEKNSNISLLSIGENFNRRKQLAFMWNNDNIYYRRRIDSGFTNWRKLAFANEIPTSLKNPYALTISLNGTSQGPYDGSAAKNINITPGSIGAAVSNHSHDYLVVNSADDTSFNSAYHSFQVLYAAGDNGITGKPANVDAFGLFKFRAAYGWSGQMLLANGGSLYIRSSEDAKMTNTLAWKTILDSSNYSGILDSRYYTESEVNSLLDAKLNRQNLSYGTWNPRGYHLAADYQYNGGDLSISENNGKMYISVDGCFWQNEGQYRVLDTSDIGGIRDSVTLHQYLSATDVAWYPLVWGGSVHLHTSDSTGPIYKSYDKLCWQASSQTLYATNIQTNNIKNLSVGGGIYWNPNVESASDNTDAASITVVRSGVTGGSTLVLSQMNDTNDTIQFITNPAARLYHNNYPILTTQNTYVSNNKGYINGTEITQVNNADTLEGYHANGSNDRPYGHIPTIESDGVMEVGKYIDFHNDNNGKHDFSTRLQSTGNYGNEVNLPSASGTLALINDVNNYYWANVKISTSSSTTTSPTFSNVYLGNSLYLRGSNSIYNGPNDSANGVGGPLNNLVFSSWQGVSFTTSCAGTTYTNKNAVSINCRTGQLYAREVQANGFMHTGHNNNDAVLLAGGGYKTLKDFIFLNKSYSYTDEGYYNLAFHKLSGICNNLVWVDGHVNGSITKNFTIDPAFFPYKYANDPNLNTIYLMSGGSYITINANGVVTINNATNHKQRVGFFYTGRA